MLDVPNVIAGGFPDPSVAESLNEAMGFNEWPELFTQIGFTVGVTLLCMSATLLLIARRKRGPVHMMRVLIGLGSLFGAFAILAKVFERIDGASLGTMLGNKQIGEALNMVFNEQFSGALFGGMVVFIVSILFLAWPPRRKFKELPTVGSYGGA